jgi:hypothetical protein
MKEFDGIAGIWTYNNIPEKDEFVLIGKSPFMDNPTEIGRSKNKEELVEEVKTHNPNIYSSLRIYNDKCLIVWDALRPSTIFPDKKEYDPEYLDKISDFFSS